MLTAFNIIYIRLWFYFLANTQCKKCIMTGAKFTAEFESSILDYKLADLPALHDPSKAEIRR